MGLWDKVKAVSRPVKGGVLGQAMGSQAINPIVAAGQSSKKVGDWYGQLTGKDAGKAESERLRKEQQTMFEKLSKEEENMSRAEQLGYNRMADPALGIEKEAKARMTMAQAQDPNNPVAVAFRNFYEQQAGAEGKKGLADVGVLSALGAQATAGQMGGGVPMTTGAMQALQAQNMGQSGQAFANVQKRMQGLRDQGIAQGWAQTEAAYGRGQDALNRFGALSQMQTDIGTGTAQRRSALLSGQSGAYQQMLAQQAQAKAMGQQAQNQSIGNFFMPMTAFGGILGSQATQNAPAASVAQYSPYTQGRQVG